VTVVDGAVDDAGEVVHEAVPGTGPGQDGVGPPTTVVGHVSETSAVVPKAARQGSETRGIGSPRVRRIPATRGWVHCCTFQCTSNHT